MTHQTPMPKSGFGFQQTAEQTAFINELRTTNSSIALNAVAGSGKTTTLVLACNALVPKAGTLLALAFNKRNAQDLEKKLPPAVDCMTLNALGHRAWQQRLGKRITLNDKKIGELASKRCTEFGCTDNWADVKNLAVHAKNVGLTPRGVPAPMALQLDSEDNWQYLIATHSLEEFSELIPCARKVLEDSIKLALEGTIDFADQLYMTCIFQAKMPQYPTVMVDEAQDLSEIQHELISRCVAPQGRLIAVGDPKQAIYGFRGAHSSSMDLLSQRFSMKEMPLSYCFRCPTKVIQRAQAIVPQIQWPEGTQEGIVRSFEESWALTPAEAADPNDHILIRGSTILCRNIAPLVRLGLQCFYNHIPCWVAARDIGAPLLKAAKELRPKEVGPSGLFVAIDDWLYSKRARANGNIELISRAEDTAEALKFVVESADTVVQQSDIEQRLKALFTREPESGSILLTTIHRAKGMEWPIVYLLDPWRIPARFTVKAAQNDPAGCSWMLAQENHLKYIAYTRAQRELYFISYPDRS